VGIAHHDSEPRLRERDPVKPSCHSRRLDLLALVTAGIVAQSLARYIWTERMVLSIVVRSLARQPGLNCKDAS
jgi:hypothetical protein